MLCFTPSIIDCINHNQKFSFMRKLIQMTFIPHLNLLFIADFLIGFEHQPMIANMNSGASAILSARNFAGYVDLTHNSDDLIIILHRIHLCLLAKFLLKLAISGEMPWFVEIKHDAMVF
ncbi:hypothetical protein TorRG33x02_162760 [Trema orientale]|uniref:Uncharacterized protein n=1 Tax=Trema orientale TaxID=63057 RepID=A0A2P5EQS5_TREOI|nr:hypothetical protein TorRG33x02_162760 [Trema orientale]